MKKITKTLSKQRDKQNKFNLTVLGRTHIGKEIGVTDKDSPIILDEQLFNERVSLLEPVVYVRDIINAYTDELRSFESEKDYQRFLDADERKLYRYMEEELDIAVSIEDNLHKKWYRPNLMLTTDILTDDFVDAKMLELSLGTNKIYEAFKFKSFHSRKPELLSDFLKEHCESKYLQCKCKLDISKFSMYHQSIIKLSLDELSDIIMSLTSSVVNKKQLIHAGKGTVIYNIQHDVRVGLLADINESLKHSVLDRNIVNINTYKLIKPCKNARLLLKKYEDGTLVPVRYTEPELISFMRYLDNSEMTDGDKVCEVNGIHYKLSRHLGLDWVQV